MKGWTTKAVAKSKKPGKPAPPRNLSAYQILIGIDPGTHTGIAIKEHGKWVSVETLTIFEAVERVKAWERRALALSFSILVRVEDARQRTWFGETGREKLKGAGSVERDCAIWQEVLTALSIEHEFVHPKNVRATTADYFERATGWDKRTSIHAREAAWLII